jgi:hypothetical protein
MQGGSPGRLATKGGGWPARCRWGLLVQHAGQIDPAGVADDEMSSRETPLAGLALRTRSGA